MRRFRSWFSLRILGWGSKRWMERKLKKMYHDITWIGNLLGCELPDKREAYFVARDMREQVSELQKELGFETYCQSLKGDE